MKVLFDSTDYRPLEQGETYENKYIIIRPDFFKDDYKEAKYQLFYAHSGFGCDPDKLGTKIFGVFCIDGEAASTSRPYVLGVAKESAIEQWEKLYETKALKEVL